MQSIQYFTSDQVRTTSEFIHTLIHKDAMIVCKKAHRTKIVQNCHCNSGEHRGQT